VIQSSWNSESSLRCKSVSGVSLSLGVKVSVSRIFGSSSEVASYDSPLLSTARLNSIPFTGSFQAIVSGHNLGHSSRSSPVRIGLTVSVLSVWLSESSIRCRVSAGNGVFAIAIVTTGRALSVMFSQASSFTTPTLSSTTVTNSATSGAISVTLFGRHSSNFGSTPVGKVGLTSGCSSLWRSSSSVTVKLASALAIRATLAISTHLLHGSASSLSSYDIATLSFASKTNLPTSGSVIFNVFGTNIGRSGGSIGARVGFSGQEFTLWTSDSSFACRSSSGFFSSGAI